MATIAGPPSMDEEEIFDEHNSESDDDLAGETYLHSGGGESLSILGEKLKDSCALIKEVDDDGRPEIWAEKTTYI